MKKTLFLGIFGLILGFLIINSIIAECTDSDGGKNYYVKGSLSGICSGMVTCGAWIDKCNDNKILLEYFCNGTDYNTNFELYTCPGECNNGACVSDKIPFEDDESCNALVKIVENQSCQKNSDCGQLNCIPTIKCSSPTETKCIYNKCKVICKVKEEINGKSPQNQLCQNQKCKNNGAYCEFDYDCPSASCMNEGEGCGTGYYEDCCPNLICSEKNENGVGKCKRNIVGNDKDEHGCIGSAGYSWCEKKQKCLRIWEENCTNECDYPTKNYITKFKDSCKMIDYGCKNDSVPFEDDCGCGCIVKQENKKASEEKIKILPETASITAREKLGELRFNITLKEVGTGNNKKTVYNLEGEKQGKFLGIFKIKGKVTAEIDAETGEIIKIKKPWWAFLAKGI